MWQDSTDTAIVSGLRVVRPTQPPEGCPLVEKSIWCLPPPQTLYSLSNLAN